MLFYESAKCLHGRMTELKGKYYGSIFLHYKVYIRIFVMLHALLSCFMFVYNDTMGYKWLLHIVYSTLLHYAILFMSPSLLSMWYIYYLLYLLTYYLHLRSLFQPVDPTVWSYTIEVWRYDGMTVWQSVNQILERMKVSELTICFLPVGRDQRCSASLVGWSRWGLWIPLGWTGAGGGGDAGDAGG